MGNIVISVKLICQKNALINKTTTFITHLPDLYHFH